MDLQDRIKVVIQILIGYKVAENQENIGKLLGYPNKSYFSQIVNGKVSLPNDFLEKLADIDTRISKEWIIKGVGSIENKQVYENHTLSEINNNNEVLSLLKDKIVLLEKNNALLERENSYLEQRLELAELKDKEAMALKIKKQRKEIDQKDEIINLQNEELNAMKSISLPSDKPLHPSKRV